jgi:hypothetical protein
LRRTNRCSVSRSKGPKRYKLFTNSDITILRNPERD